MAPVSLGRGGTTKQPWRAASEAEAGQPKRSLPPCHQRPRVESWCRIEPIVGPAGACPGCGSTERTRLGLGLLAQAPPPLPVMSCRSG